MRHRLHTPGAVVLSALTLLGCDSGGDGPGALGEQPHGVIVWADDEDRAPGIGQLSVYYHGGLFVVWSDSDRGGGGSSSANAHGVACEGFLLSPQDERIEFRCTSPDGTTGSATIDRRTYDLVQGRLFLVGSRGDAVRVHQLDCQIRTPGLSGPRLRAIAEETPEIRAFFTHGDRETR